MATAGCIGFIGMGSMGMAMVKHLLAESLAEEVIVWNRSLEKCDEVRNLGASVASSLHDLVSAFVSKRSDAIASSSVHLMLTGDEATLSVVKELTNLGLTDTSIISHASTSPEPTKECAELCENSGNTFVCAPVTGRPPAALSGQLIIWASSNSTSASALRLAEANVLKNMGRSVHTISDSDVTKASAYKLITNFLLYASGEMFAETAVMLESNGIERSSLQFFMDELVQGSIFHQYGTRIAKEDYSEGSGAPLRIAVKDLHLIKQMAGGAFTPSLDATVRNMSEAQNREGGNLDWCAIAQEVKRQSSEEGNPS
ncbi:hypothetical protein NDN08_006848 [Rhodosorus marinus]|uniref:6-phosphogluconate dehydrogenase NADP-binding domain-containing protein n=1 Tax=Rhodosorus marinus TaxID=101924 RepID=A0AAV8ULK7_9RHOD|nr:hypothetical protein NDN08_006848 [Rhodosorus marinus]